MILSGRIEFTGLYSKPGINPSTLTSTEFLKTFIEGADGNPGE